MKVTCFSPGANGDNWASENYGAVGSTSSGGIPLNMTEESTYIDFSNFDYDDCYSKVKVNFDGNMHVTGSWTEGTGVITIVKLFDAISGTWSNSLFTCYENPTQAKDRWVPIGHFVPYYVDKNDDQWLFYNSEYVSSNDGQEFNEKPYYNTNGPMERFMAGFWDIKKNSSGNYPFSNTLENSQNLFRHFCITKAIVWYGVFGGGATSYNSYVQLGNGSITSDKFTIACRFQFPSLVGKHVIANGAMSSAAMGGTTSDQIYTSATRQTDYNPQGGMHPDFFEASNGGSDRHNRWFVRAANNAFHYEPINSSDQTQSSAHLTGLSHPTLVTTRPIPAYEDTAFYSDGHGDTSALMLFNTGYAYPCGYQDVIATKVGAGTKIRATWQQTGAAGHVGDYII